MFSLNKWKLRWTWKTVKENIKTNQPRRRRPHRRPVERHPCLPCHSVSTTGVNLNLVGCWHNGIRSFGLFNTSLSRASLFIFSSTNVEHKTFQAGALDSSTQDLSFELMTSGVTRLVHACVHLNGSKISKIPNPKANVLLALVGKWASPFFHQKHTHRSTLTLECPIDW